MAKYFDGSRGATEKLKSAVWGFESREGVLYGCITATLAAPFTQKEEAEFKEWCVGQNADGLGEGAEQQEIEIDDGVMYVSYYVKDNHEGIISREEFNRAQEELVRRNCRAPASGKTAITLQGKYSKYALSEIMHCAECGSRYRRCTWSKNGKKKVVWRCVSRLDYGTTYCKRSPTVPEEAIQSAIVQAIRRFYSEDEKKFMLLMKETIGDAIGINAADEEAGLLQQRVDTLNKKMLRLVDQSITSGTSMDDMDGEFQEIAQEIGQLNRRIQAIQESRINSDEQNRKLQFLSETIEQKRQHPDTYDDTIVRQMIECIRIHPNGKAEIIFGGGETIEEQLQFP